MKIKSVELQFLNLVRLGLMSEGIAEDVGELEAGSGERETIADQSVATLVCFLLILS
jgi:hypothetical protein